MATWVDSHCHVFMLDDPPAVVDRAVDAGIEWMLVPGVDLETSLQARQLAMARPDRVLWATGLHPHEAERWNEEQARISALAVGAAAIGEVGLDYYRNLSPPEAQRVAFRDQVQLASDLDKPVIVHTRDAFADVYEILAEADLGEHAVLHCWTGGPRWTKRFRELGVTFSFAGPITYATGDTVRRAAAEAPPDRTMVETDTPYLTPEPHRSEANRPEWSILNGLALADIWGMSGDDVARLTSATAARVFGSPRG
ncbi:MAG TPA: TatD family hydrolase [Acidimicrobiia bacterium]|nr:TatD family hydrolase [Acidimicrobiia bacterium]